MMQPLACLNGRFLSADEVQLPIHDAGLVSGVTVTDYCRTYAGRLFRWPDHLARFRRDCAACFIPLPWADNELTDLAEQLIRCNLTGQPAGGELALVMFATPGSLGSYASVPRPDGPPTLVLHTVPLSLARYRRFFTEGAVLAIAGHHAADPEDLAPPAIKHRSRLHWWRASHLLRQRSDVPADAVALLTAGPGGPLTETAIGHLLLVQNQTLVTPPVGRVLAGISLQVVRELAAELELPMCERDLTLADCATASEALLCGSAFGVAGIRWLEGQGFPWPGPITRRLQEAWSGRVGLDIVAQMRNATV
jgi:branched-chain amino acid aminotransferase